MIGALMFLNSRGDVIISRAFRDGFNVRGLAETFRNQLISTYTVDRNPINVIEGFCFVHARFHDLYLVLVSNQNVNCFLCLQYAVQLLDLCYAYFDNLGEEVLKENFVALQQIIDETMDFGYPQSTDPRLLSTYITPQGVNVSVTKQPKEAEKTTKKVVGKTPWRSEGLWYSVNELFLDVFEENSVLLSQTGVVLENMAIGRVMVKNFLSGMPECRLVLSDDFAIEDTSVHSCARLTQGRVIDFIPVDGVFSLLRYRAAMRLPPPLKLQNARVTEVSKTRTEVEFTLKCEVPEGVTCSEVEVRVPCPENAADVKVVVGKGKARFDGVQHAIIWKLPTLQKDAEVSLSAEIVLITPTLPSAERLWSRPPIKIHFTIPLKALSGFTVSDLKVEEPRLGYAPQKWVRYSTKAGQYECRI